VQEDQNNNYDKAFELYKIALEYFSTHLKYEKNPRSRAAIQEKVGTWGSAQKFRCAG
jgi:MIT (microtubule interacting and transport) domain